VKRNTAILANKTRKAMVISDNRIVSIIICLKPTVLNIFKIVGIVVHGCGFYSTGTVITNTVPKFIRMPQLLISDIAPTVFALIALAASQYGRMVLVW